MEQKERLNDLERRIEKLELNSHPPQGWEDRIELLYKKYMKLYDLLTNKMKENR